MIPKDETSNEGSTKEWQDRARVVLDAKEAAQHDASPKQSPVPEADEQEDVEEKSKDLEKRGEADAGNY